MMCLKNWITRLFFILLFFFPFNEGFFLFKGDIFLEKEANGESSTNGSDSDDMKDLLSVSLTFYVIPVDCFRSLHFLFHLVVAF